MDDAWFEELAVALPHHADLIRCLADQVEGDERWRWFDVCCSLGSGRGDELSDIDCAIGYAQPLADGELDRLGGDLVAGVGDIVDVLVHRMDGWPPDVRRFAVEFGDGLQLDLVMMPATRMNGLRDGEVEVVDKDGNLAGQATSTASGPPDEQLTREWALMGWWWLSDVAKYLRRGALFEAAERIALVRQNALRLFAAGAVPYPSYGLTSLLDYAPFELPEGLAATYPQPAYRASVISAALAVADLLDACASRAVTALGHNLSTGWSGTARSRLEAAGATN